MLVRDPTFSWVRRYPMLVKSNPVAQKEGTAGYEVALNYVGLPYELIPRAASEIPTKSEFVLLSVNEEERKKHPCRKLVVQRLGRWDLTNAGQHLIDLLTF